MQRIGNADGPVRRIELIDFLRGFCLAAMTIDHLPHSPIEVFTWQTFGFISAAEGFVFLSGLVIGTVYGRTARTQGLSSLTSRAFRRLRTLYLTNVIFISLAFLASRHGLVVIGNGVRPSWSLWVESLMLISAPGYSEILRLYCVFFFFLPLIFWALLRERMREVVILSFMFWFVARLGYGMTAIPNSGYFDLISWQLLFVVGICCGFQQHIAAWTKKSWREEMLTVASGLVVAAFFIVRHERFLFGATFSPYLAWLSTWRRTLPIGRLVNFAALTYLVYRFRSSFHRVLESFPGRALVYLGQHSLPVFVWGVSLSMVTAAAHLHGHWFSHSPLGSSILDSLMFASCFVPAWVHSHWGAAVRQPATALKPVALRT